MRKILEGSIRSQLTWSLALSLIIAFATMTAGIVIVLERRFQKLEQNEVRLEIERIRDLVQNEVDSFHPIIKDWGEWDDMYEFVTKPNQEFIETNLYPEVLDQVALDSFRVYDLQARLKFALDRPQEENDTTSVTQLLKGIQLNSGLFPPASETMPRAGLIQLDGTLFRFTVLPIRNSKTDLPPSGYIAFFKKVDKNFENKLQRLSKKNLTIRHLDNEGLHSTQGTPLPAKLKNLLKRRASELDVPYFLSKKAWVRVNNQTITAALLAKDCQGQDRLLLQFPIERILMREGKALISQMIWAFIAISILALAFQLLVVNRILGRLQDLVLQIERLSHTPSSGLRLRPSGRDELRSLAHSFNGLLNVLDKNQAGMRAILENVKSGFLIIDQQSQIQSGATRAACEIFERENLTKLTLSSLLYESEKDSLHFLAMLEQLFDSLIPLELSLDQVPNRFRCSKKHILIDWVPLSQNGEVYGVLCTLHDVTHLDEVELENNTNKALLRMLRNRNGFQSLLEDTYDSIQKARKFERESPTAQRDFRRILHTIKGNLGVFGLSEVVRFIHEIEGQDTIERRDFDAVESAIASFLKAHFKVLELSFDGYWDPSFRVYRSQLLRFIEESHTWGGLDQAKSEAESLAQALMRIPAHQILDPMLDDCRRLAERLGKKVHVELSGGSLPIDALYTQPLFKNLIHALRNAIVHGIELPTQRRGKPEKGLLHLQISEHKDSTLLLRLEDDGQGIASSKLKALAVERGLLTQGEADGLSELDALELVFLDGLSTQKSASEVAGRGVGMSALKQAVLELGGQISIESRFGQGTTLYIFCPMHPASQAPVEKSA